MAHSKQTPDHPNHSQKAKSRNAEDIQNEAEAQVDLMGDAAVDPQPLVDAEKDPITQQVRDSSDSK